MESHILISCAAPQGSEEWKAARAGKVTASRVADVIAKKKNGWGASRANYMAELIAERLTGVAAEGFTNQAMNWGTEKEPEARTAYCFFRDIEVAQVGFIEHPSIPMTGCSPDGLIRDDGLLEIKCPNTATHIETLLSADIPQKYITQMQWQLACTGRQYCDFCSYDPRLPESMQVFISRVMRDQPVIHALEKAVEVFIAELDAKVSALRTKFEEAA